jgi:hypothetical protein
MLANPVGRWGLLVLFWDNYQSFRWALPIANLFRPFRAVIPSSDLVVSDTLLDWRVFEARQALKGRNMTG